MGSGSWSNDSTTSLTLPTGATSGARIELDGTTDLISIYNSAGVLVDTIGGPNGSITIGNTSGQHFQFDPSTDVLNIFDSSNQLVGQWDTTTNTITMLDNNNLFFTQLSCSAIGVTGVGLNIGNLSSPGVLPTAAQITNGTQYAGGGVNANILSGQTSSGNFSDAAILHLSAGNPNHSTLDGFSPSCEIYDFQNNSPVLGMLDGAWTKSHGGVSFTWQVPTPNANFALGSTASASYQNMQYRYDAEDNLVVEGAMHATAALGAGPYTLFNLPVGYRPAKIHATAGIHASSGDVTKATVRVNVDSSGAVGIYTTSAIAINDNFYWCVTVPLGNIS